MRTTALHPTLGLLALFAPIAAHAQSGMPANCPMHAEHQKQAAAAAAVAPASTSTPASGAEPTGHAGHAGRATTAPAASPYVDFTDRAIAALSEEEIAALRAGAGHGMALPAELHHYPGPRHLIDMAGDLALETHDVEMLQAIYERMHAGAVALGEQIVAGERELDRLFAGGNATSAEVARLTAEIAQLQGRLRAAHLVAHVEARALLSSDQIARYDTLRGYSSAAGAK